MVGLLSQAAASGGAILSSTHHCSLKFALPIPPLFSKRCRRCYYSNTRPRLKPLSLASDSSSSSGGATTNPTSSTIPFHEEEGSFSNSISFVPQQNVPLEGVIHRVALLAGGDVAALLLFSAIGRFSHGFSVFDLDTFKTADPFIAGWFLSAYFLGGYGEEGRGTNGLWRAVTAATKSWSLGIPLGLIIRSATIGHTPSINFIFVTMGSTAVLLLVWRAILLSILPSNHRKENDVYKRGSPFELFELLTSLVRRW
ncbi:hypothetical protein BUALT_Bualt08G0033900 [Buddleja alternifolia]|uniref:Transmembrane protein n=1 Tax=Buddleja alternifolia TaxID=168488 RepID=A0AAV6X4L0_9LAMI|nr:hypothetical protein BUALT_Bualt08G0033900 [Buddleja alternifolia]